MKAKNRTKKLESHIADYNEMCKSTIHELQVQKRIDNNGFHKPGSNNK